MSLLPLPSPPSLGEVRSLLEAGTPPHVSLFLPLQRAWNRAKVNRLRLGRLLDDAAAALARRGVGDADAQALLAPVRSRLDDEAFWAATTADGLAFFTARSHVSTLALPFSVPERPVVDDRFHVRPLLRALTPDGPFFLLALSQGGVRLFQGTRYTFEEVPLTGVPTTLEEALQFDEHVRSVTFHTRSHPGAGGNSGRRAAMYHGHEDAGDKAYVKEGILRFFQPLDTEVRRLLGQRPTPPPLVLAGVAPLRGLYRKVNHYPHLTDTDVEGHPVDRSSGDVDADALHARAWAVVAPLYAADAANDRERFEQLVDADRATTSLHAIVAAAYAHRIDTLFVSDDGEAWGRFTPATHRVEVHTAPAPTDVELLNAAIAWTLDGNGTVHVVAPTDVPGQTPAAALLRY